MRISDRENGDQTNSRIPRFHSVPRCSRFPSTFFLLSRQLESSVHQPYSLVSSSVIRTTRLDFSLTMLSEENSLSSNPALPKLC